MVGIILAGGAGSRLGPITKVTSKQLLPIYDKPMIFYPISLLMAANFQEIVIICTARDIASYKELLGDGSRWGIKFHFFVQDNPNGLPEAFLIAKDVIKGKKSTLILGDNVLYGSQLGKKVYENAQQHSNHIYGYLVKDASQFGVLEIAEDGELLSVVEKPIGIGRGMAIPGIYHFDETVVERVRTLKKSARGELEITELLSLYIKDNSLTYSILDRGVAWLDTGTIDDLFMASELVRVVQSRQGMLIGSPDEVAYLKKWIDVEQLRENSKTFGASLYGLSIADLINDL
jgi:glucose-1-phosphate thymidylyltransferase